MPVVAARDDGLPTPVLDDLDGLHIIITHAQPMLLAVELMPRRLGGLSAPLTLSIAGNNILPRAPHHELPLAGRVNVGINYRHEHAPVPRLRPPVPSGLGLGQQGLELQGALVPAAALPCHGLGELGPGVGARGRYGRVERGEAVPDKDAPPIVGDEVVQSPAGEGEGPEIMGALELAEDEVEDVVGQVGETMGHDKWWWRPWTGGPGGGKHGVSSVCRRCVLLQICCLDSLFSKSRWMDVGVDKTQHGQPEVCATQEAAIDPSNLQ